MLLILWFWYLLYGNTEERVLCALRVVCAIVLAGFLGLTKPLLLVLLLKEEKNIYISVRIRFASEAKINRGHYYNAS